MQTRNKKNEATYRFFIQPLYLYQFQEILPEEIQLRLSHSNCGISSSNLSLSYKSSSTLLCRVLISTYHPLLTTIMTLSWPRNIQLQCGSSMLKVNLSETIDCQGTTINDLGSGENISKGLLQGKKFIQQYINSGVETLYKELQC